MSSGGGGRAVPYINVTPLIDVLLVLLIIFMVVTPLKPKRFMTQIPKPPPPPPPGATPKPLLDTLKVRIYGDHPKDQDGKEIPAKANMVEFIHVEGDRLATGGGLAGDMVGTFTDDKPPQFTGSQALAALVQKEFNDPDRGEDKRTVYIQAPKNYPYGKIVQVIDAIKAGGSLWCADPSHRKETRDPDPTKAKPSDCPQVPVGLQLEDLEP